MRGFNRLSSESESEDWFVSLLPSLQLLRSAPKPVEKKTLAGGGRTFSLWDQFEVGAESEEWTLQDFLQSLQTQFGMRATMVVQGTKMVYVAAMPMHKKRLTKR